MKRLATGYIKEILGLAMLLGAQVTVTAGVITPTVYSTQVCAGGCKFGNSGTVSNAYGQASVGGVPSPFADVQGTSDSTHTFGGSASVKYYFEYSSILNGSLPIDIAYSMIWHGDPDNSTEFLQINFVGFDGFRIPDTFSSGSRSDVLHGTLSANQIYEVDLFADVAFYPSSNGLTAEARVDPVISIDPSFTGNPSDYSLLLSPDVGNSETAATPEPGTGLLMAGVTVIAVLRQRRAARQRASDRR